MAECHFPQALTMAESPRCCSAWARCFHCLYSCHWRKFPKERMRTSKVDRGWGAGSPRHRPLGRGERGHVCAEAVGGGAFSSQKAKLPQIWKELPTEQPNAWQEAP